MIIDEQLIGITGPFIRYAVEDIEGFGIDDGKKYGGFCLIYFFDEETADKYCHTDDLGDRRIIYGKERGGEQRIFMRGALPWQEAIEVDNLSQFRHLGYVTVLIVKEATFCGEEIVAAARLLKTLGADSIYAYVSHLESVVLDGGEGSLAECLNNSDIIGELFTADIVYLTCPIRRLTVIKPTDLSFD